MKAGVIGAAAVGAQVPTPIRFERCPACWGAGWQHRVIPGPGARRESDPDTLCTLSRPRRRGGGGMALIRGLLFQPEPLSLLLAGAVLLFLGWLAKRTGLLG